ncbi:carbohydrate ABC transporter permease [Paenibacillus spongiae]|uniref:Sugar ABC transporter permease n=1 Tax=Paenibacillus spongiae TaxID=2909671 RepID=A0ABY5S961_9BACL|nr:sugar ABC transporter permease [Paenibacillus spongiae]UVI29335.1 sugar ABC transporter permease [Paenibacillus spongiae]
MMNDELQEGSAALKRPLWSKIREQLAPGIMLLPFMLNQYVLFVITAVIVILISFTSMDSALQWNFNGLDNFKRALIDPAIGLIIWNTVLFVCVTMFIKVVWGLTIALSTTYYIRSQRVGRLFRMIWLLPRVSPGVVEALLWIWIFSSGSNGILNLIMHALYGWEPVNWLDRYPLMINIALSGIMGSSMSMIIFSSAIQSIEKSYFYVAKVDGASEWVILRKLMLPFLKWPLTFLLVWQGLSMFTSYESILLLTDGGPMNRSETWALYAFHTAFSTLNFGYGSAISLFILPVVVLAMFISYRVFGFKKMMKSAQSSPQDTERKG